jgi:hypothetical protein
MFNFDKIASSLRASVAENASIADVAPEKAEVAINSIKAAIHCYKSLYEFAREQAKVTPSEATDILSEAEVLKEAILEAEVIINKHTDAAGALAEENAASTSNTFTTIPSSITYDTDVNTDNTSTEATAIEVPTASVSTSTTNTTAHAGYAFRKQRGTKRRLLDLKDGDYVYEEIEQPLDSFSAHPIETLMPLYELPAALEELSKFNLKLQPCNIDLDFVAKQVQSTINSNAQIVEEILEVGRYPLITPVLNAVVAKHNIKYWAQYPLLNGVIAQGYPDWAFIHDEKPIFIIEGKGKTKIDMKAIAQVVLVTTTTAEALSKGLAMRTWL